MTQNTITVEIDDAGSLLTVTLVGEGAVQQFRKRFTFTEDGYPVSVWHDGERYRTAAATEESADGA